MLTLFSRLENDILANEAGLQALEAALTRSTDTLLKRKNKKRLIIDLDSTEDPAHGKQEGVAYNGHFAISPNDSSNGLPDCRLLGRVQRCTIIRPGQISADSSLRKPGAATALVRSFPDGEGEGFWRYRSSEKLPGDH